MAGPFRSSRGFSTSESGSNVRSLLQLRPLDNSREHSWSGQKKSLHCWQSIEISREFRVAHLFRYWRFTLDSTKESPSCTPPGLPPPPWSVVRSHLHRPISLNIINTVILNFANDQFILIGMSLLSTDDTNEYVNNVLLIFIIKLLYHFSKMYYRIGHRLFNLTFLLLVRYIETKSPHEAPKSLNVVYNYRVGSSGPKWMEHAYLLTQSV